MVWRDGIALDNEPAKVVIKRGEFVDSSRLDDAGEPRVIPYKIYHPVDYDYESLPVILWSHGFGGNRDGAAFLSRFIAAYGYVIVHMSHAGTDSGLWEGKPGHPWDILRNLEVPRTATLDRFMDVSYALGSLKRWAVTHPDGGRHMDFDNIGVSGHSLGSLTAQALAGQMVPGVDEKLVSLREKRAKAAIFYSPVTIDSLPDASPKDLYGPIAIPALHMTGTDDDSPISGYDYKHRLQIFENTNHSEKYFIVKKGGDHMVYNGTRGKLSANPNRARHEQIIQLTSLAFWEAQLRGDKAAQDWIDGQGIKDYLGEDAKWNEVY